MAQRCILVGIDGECRLKFARGLDPQSAPDLRTAAGSNLRLCPKLSTVMLLSLFPQQYEWTSNPESGSDAITTERVRIARL
jgi:hypothetical protein